MWTGADTRRVADGLAGAFLDGPWQLDALVERARRATTSRGRWVVLVAEALVDAYPEAPRDRYREVRDRIEHELRGMRLPSRPPAVRVQRAPRAEFAGGRWPVPAISTEQELADYLGVAASDLRWLADPGSFERRASPRAANYSYRWLERRSGVPRLVEAPKPWLAKLQRRVLRGVLDHVPPHEAAHGFRRGHSAVTHARRHVGARVVLRFDLRDFFAHVSAGRVFGTFRAAGYPEQVAWLLTALVTNAAPVRVLGSLAPSDDRRVATARHELRTRLATAHLPQGAPTSPALANLAAYRLDRRLDGLAMSLGATYTRYADDIAISGGRHLADGCQSLRGLVGGIVEECGFRCNERKSQLMVAAGRQQLTGIVVNARTNVAREDYDELRAVLHDARLHGFEHAGRGRWDDPVAHLSGRVSWVEALNPDRGAKLRAMLGAAVRADAESAPTTA